MGVKFDSHETLNGRVNRDRKADGPVVEWRNHCGDKDTQGYLGHRFDLTIGRYAQLGAGKYGTA